MPTTCEFQLNSPNDVYYSGQCVSGTIVLKTTSEKTIRNVRIRFLGEAKVHFATYKTHGGRRTRIVHFDGHEVYIDNTTVVREEGTLPAGTHTYTFNIQLPISSPTSCEAKHGHIRYELWLKVDRPFRVDHEFSKSLRVVRTVDLNLNPAFKLPIQAEEISSIGCWPCASGKISYVLRVPLGAYVPGQTLLYSLLIQNQSTTNIRGCHVEFQESRTYTADDPNHETIERITVKERQDHSETCGRLSNKQFEGAIVIPAVPPDTEGECIVRIKHYLELEIILGGCHKNNTITIPIFIGNVPMRESMTKMPQAPPPGATESNDNGFSEIMPSAPLLPPSTDEKNEMAMPPTYRALKPPSFEAAIRSSSTVVDPNVTNVIGFGIQ